MSGKSLYSALLSAALASALCGCSIPGAESQEHTDISAQDVKIVETEYFPDNKQDESKGSDNTVNYNTYPAGHTLNDGSITFADSVAVLSYDELVSYVPETNTFTIPSEINMDGCKYVYVYYNDTLLDYMFQRIVGTGYDENGNTTLTLSGIPLEEEMGKSEFLSLITDVNMYGTAKGDDSDAFTENKRLHVNEP